MRAAHVFRSVAMVVEYGLAHRDLSGVTAVGVDETQMKARPAFKVMDRSDLVATDTSSPHHPYLKRRFRLSSG